MFQGKVTEAMFQGKVTEAMKWLEDEREARSYLHTLANKMHEELDGMKTATIRVSGDVT